MDKRTKTRENDDCIVWLLQVQNVQKLKESIEQSEQSDVSPSCGENWQL